MTDELCERLTAVQRQRQKIREAQENIDAMYEDMVSPASPKFNADRVQSTPEDPMLRYAVKMDKEENNLRKLREELPAVKRKTITFIRKTSRPEYATILIAIYVTERRSTGEGKDKDNLYERIADELNYSLTSVFRFRREGLRELEQVIAEEHGAKVGSE